MAYFDGKQLKKFFGYVMGTLSTEIRGSDTSEKWSDLWYVFIPQNNTLTMAEMTDKLRANRKDGYINPFLQFSELYLNK